MVAPSSLRSASHALNSMRRPAMSFQPPTEAELRATISCLERETRRLEAAQGATHTELRHLQCINDANVVEVEHLLSKLSIANEAILGFREAFSNIENHVVEMETNCRAEKAEKESIVDNLTQTFQVNVALLSRRRTEKLVLLQPRPPLPIMPTLRVLFAHTGFDVLRQFAIEANTPELQALLEAINCPLELNLMFFHKVLGARHLLKQLYTFNCELVAHRSLQHFPSMDTMVLGHMVCRAFPSFGSATPSPQGTIAPPTSPTSSSSSTDDSLLDLVPVSDSSSGLVSSKHSADNLDKDAGNIEGKWDVIDVKHPKLEHSSEA
ncbi:hypothetical protein BT96DRAFT_947766 [Gymnopus androsaceus JB14]|uniref:Uncharacterized protein n=1 Tax=Gymnopus androsaceus JB14 TaxID=1447944 RepID=A0A6A4GR36_9AGAR|nr:hypothetical protein BT96DRAFT_947766 [Gymnopus androsaceus JB14]